MTEIYDGKPKTEREARFWKKAGYKEDEEFLELVIDAEELGLNKKAWLTSYIATAKRPTAPKLIFAAP